MRKLKAKRRSEKSIQNAIRNTLERAGWLTEKTHGNRYQPGWPDLMCWQGAEILSGFAGVHDDTDIGCPDGNGSCFGCVGGILKWLEVKRPGGKLTPRQVTRFAKWEAAGLGVWVAAKVDGVRELLGDPPNWREWLPATRRPSSPGSKRPSPASPPRPSGRRAGASR